MIASVHGQDLMVHCMRCTSLWYGNVHENGVAVLYIIQINIDSTVLRRAKMFAGVLRTKPEMQQLKHEMALLSKNVAPCTV